MKKTISPTTLYQVELLFKKKQWDNKDQFPERLKEDFIARLNLFDEIGQRCFIDLANDFISLSLNDVNKLIKLSYNKINHDILLGYDKIFFIPLITPEVKQKSILKTSNFKILNKFYKVFKIEKNIPFVKPFMKSGDFIYKLFQIDYDNLYKCTHFEFPTDYIRFQKVFNKNKDLLILIDDFIGSGFTAKEVIEYYLNQGFKIENILILVIASQNEGDKFLKETYPNLKIYSYYNLEKGIDDNIKIQQEYTDINNLIRKMSENIRIKQDYFGYENSQSLISFINKTPNNTLPIFWHENKSMPAPFPRKRINKNLKYGN